MGDSGAVWQDVREAQHADRGRRLAQAQADLQADPWQERVDALTPWHWRLWLTPGRTHSVDWWPSTGRYRGVGAGVRLAGRADTWAELHAVAQLWRIKHRALS
jgi:hypothetical protein